MRPARLGLPGAEIPTVFVERTDHDLRPLRDGAHLDAGFFAGDVVELEIAGLGRSRQTVKQAIR
ncbi:hypothetical protein ACPPVO_54230 [Dactylosporangium sp. McL0621]|uniref:hypothetical protein n=1 Tax=Dactylosporangium sp. McL0621 TaxID=3415678 RepID=UPI003CF3DA09